MYVNFNSFYSSLLERVEKGLITRKVKDDLELYNYTNLTTFSKAWDEYTLLARGLVVCPSEKKIFPTLKKFFNFNERPEKLPDLPFEVFDKLDGSAIICFNHKNKWHCVTRGSFDSDQAKFAQDHIDSFMPNLDTTFTYIFEAIYPANKIVVDYGDFAGLVLLTGFSNIDFREIPVEQLWNFSFIHLNRDKERYRLVQKFKGYNNLEEVLKFAEQDQKNKEGFVIRYSNGHRIKIKTSEYIRLHKLISRITPLGVWEIMNGGDNIDSILLNLPEEFHKDFKTIYNILENQVRNIKLDLLLAWEDFVKSPIMYDNPRKSLANFIKLHYPHLSTYMFMMADNKNMEEINKAILKKIRPTGNKLENYTPSTLMNMFQTDN